MKSNSVFTFCGLNLKTNAKLLATKNRDIMIIPQNSYLENNFFCVNQIIFQLKLDHNKTYFLAIQKTSVVYFDQVSGA